MKQATYIGKAVSTNSNSREYEHPTMQSTPSQTNTTHFPPKRKNGSGIITSMGSTFRLTDQLKI